MIVGDPDGGGEEVSIGGLTSSMSPLHQSSPAVLEPSATGSSLAILASSLDQTCETEAVVPRAEDQNFRNERSGDG
jgi:hypothetical protein